MSSTDRRKNFLTFPCSLPCPTKASKPPHSHLYWEFHELGGRVAVRKGPWKAVKYDYLAAPDAPAELYYLPDDIGETNNVAAEHPEVLAEMEGLLKESRTESGVFRFE